MEIELKNYRAFSDEAPARWLIQDGFTALVGVNNSGKSSLLRFFHEIRPSLEHVTDRPGLRGLLISHGEPEVHFQSVADNREVFHNGNTRPMSATFSISNPDSNEPAAIRLIWNRDLKLRVEVEWEGQVTSKASHIKSWPRLVFETETSRPTLDLGRYLKAFEDLAGSIYLGPFRNAVNVGGQAAYYDLEIGERFIAQWDEIKTGNDRDRNRSAVAVQEELRKIFGLKRLEINASPGNATMQIIADDEPYQLQEQGAGFAQFVVVMAYVATQKPAYILIDEPELNLHPSLQLDFLTTLARYSSRGVAFATHSIGLARAVGQRVYSVSRDSSGRRQVHELSAVRDMPSFSGSSATRAIRRLGLTESCLLRGQRRCPLSNPGCDSMESSTRLS